MSSFGPYGQQGQPPQGPPPQGQPFARPGQPYPPQGYPPNPPQPGFGQPPAYGPPSQPPPHPVAKPTLRTPVVPVLTMEAVPGREIAAVLGPVVGVVARLRELPPQARTGTMTEAYGAMLVTSRQDAVDQLAAMAETAGADAVVGLRFDSSEITQSLSEVTAYGTAVRLVPDPAAASPATPAAENPWRPASAPADGWPPS